MYFRRARKLLRDHLKSKGINNALKEYICVRALKSEGNIFVWLWETERITFLCEATWEQVVDSFLYNIRVPGMHQGEFHREDAPPLEVNMIIATAARSGILVELPAYITNPFKLKRSTPYNLDRRSENAARDIRAVLGTEEEVQNWQWAADKVGDQALSKLHRLAQNSHKPATLGGLEALLLLADFLLSEPNINGEIIREKPLDLQGIENTLNVRCSSSGKDLPGNPGGSSKRENAVWAIKEFMEKAAGKEQKVPFVYEVQPKGNEILKKSKPQRKIFAQSTADNITTQICTHGLVYRPMSMCSKSASSLSMGGNTGYQMLRHLTPDLPWDECEKDPGQHQGIVKEAFDLVSGEDALAEEDKTEWEYNLDITLKALFLLATVIQTDWKEKENYLLPFVHSAASFLCPLIGIQGTFAIAAKHFMPSGHLWTLKGNTAAHKFIVLSFKQHKLETCEDLALLWYLTVLLLGDDFISRNIFGAEYSTFTDNKWGCITKAVFGGAKKVRFLQRQLQWVKGQPRFAYDLERAKIKISIARKELYDHAEAIKATVLSTGSEQLLEQLRPFYIKMKVPKVILSAGDRCTDAAFLDEGVLNTFWSANNQLKRDVGTYFKLGNKFSMTPNYFDDVYNRARKQQ